LTKCLYHGAGHDAWRGAGRPEWFVQVANVANTIKVIEMAGV
jgi:hypothetical protein